jgi:hypothetical protein
LVRNISQATQKRGQASPDDGDPLALTFAQPVQPAEVEEEDEEEEFGRYTGSGNSGWMRRSIGGRHGRGGLGWLN